MVTLFINRYDSECGACLDGADPYEKAHITRLGWVAASSPEGSPLRRGCGAEFTQLSSQYGGDDMKRAVMAMRPDLPWAGDIL